MVRLEKDKLIIEIATATPAETLYAMQNAILGLMESYDTSIGDWQDVADSATLLKAMLPMLNDEQ